MVDCTLCAELDSHTSRAPWNEPLIETDNFAVVPSLGALVEGWLLIVPKRHYISMGALPIELREEADALERQTRHLLKSKYRNSVIGFEHGPSAAHHGTGCGVDHAHLHLVPLDCDLQLCAKPFMPPGSEWLECGWGERANAYASGLDYLYLCPGDMPGRIAVSDDFGSQVFRKAIAAHLGIEAEFNWRVYPKFELVTRTIDGIVSARALAKSRGVEYAI